MLTILVTSTRVAPGLLSWPAWDALRSACRVLVGSSSHPQIPALAAAGVVPEVVDAPVDVAGLAALLLDAAVPPGSTVWLPAAGEEAPQALLDALSAAGGTLGEVRVLPGSSDLPGAHLLDVVATMDTLRVSCPWDRKQTHASLGPSLLEESYEALEVLESGDHQALREELGDVLLNVVFHARIAAERSMGEGGYTIDDIADTLVAKLVRRHPHVFADTTARSADDVIRNWDEIKKAERAAKLAPTAAPPSVLDGVVFGQPALALAAQVLRRAARAGFPLPAALLDGPGLDRSDRDGTGLDGGGPASAAPGVPGALGDALLRLAAVAREMDADPEAELRAAARRLAVMIRDWELQQP